MKKTMYFGLALGLGIFAMSVGTASAVGPVTGGGGIVGSYHDLSAAAYGDTQSRICVFCHHPHQAQKALGTGMTGVDYSPLWNHTITTNQGSFTAYSNGNGPTSGRNMLNATLGQPGGASLLCLSCHDGSVALNAYSTASSASKVGGTGVGANNVIIADERARIGTAGDLTNHHPVGFNYLTVVQADAEIADASKTISGTTTIGDLLYGGTQFECVTCHDVHNSQNTGEKFLWISNNGSAFCLACHEKGATHTNGGY